MDKPMIQNGFQVSNPEGLYFKASDNICRRRIDWNVPQHLKNPKNIPEMSDILNRPNCEPLEFLTKPKGPFHLQQLNSKT